MEPRKSTRSATTRLKLIKFITYAGFATIAFRLAYIQIWCHHDLLKRKSLQTERYERPLLLRGSLLDRKGMVLAKSITTLSFFADPSLINNVYKTSVKLSPIFQMPVYQIAKRIQKDKTRFIWLKRHMNPGDVSLNKIAMAGIGAIKENKRVYPEGSLATPLLGQVGWNEHGASGLELTCDKILTPEEYGIIFHLDGRRRKIRNLLNSNQGLSNTTVPRHVKLTIDRNVQYIAERELEAGRTANGAKSGVAVVQDPFTGEILAIANSPNNRNNDEMFSGQARVPAATDSYEPGSTFKILTFAAAIEKGLVSQNQNFWCENGAWKYAGITIHDHEPHGMLTTSKVIGMSSNIGSAKIALTIGKDQLYAYIKAFGFGAKPGLKLPGESPGLLRKPERWSEVSTPILGFGQEIGVTAVQLIGAFSVIANGGKLMRPSLISAVLDQNREPVWTNAPVPVRQVISPETAAIIRRFLAEAVTNGTGIMANIKGFSVAGKTGTAQKIDPQTRKYSATKVVSSFCGFVPAGITTAPSDVPRFVIYVAYDEPKGEGWGGTCAAPVFKKIAEYLISYYGIPVDTTLEVRKQPSQKPELKIKMTSIPKPNKTLQAYGKTAE